MTAPISNGPTTTRLHHYAGRYSCTTASTVSRSQYRSAPSPQVYSSHRQPRPWLRRPWSHSRIWTALLPWQEARPSRSRGTSSATLSQSRQTHQASWRSNHSHIPSQTSPPPAPEANDHASTPDPQTRKASHSLDFTFDVQETGGSSSPWNEAGAVLCIRAWGSGMRSLFFGGQCADVDSPGIASIAGITDVVLRQCRMQFPCKPFKYINGIVGIATFVGGIESCLRGIACDIWGRA